MLLHGEMFGRDRLQKYEKNESLLCMYEVGCWSGFYRNSCVYFPLAEAFKVAPIDILKAEFNNPEMHHSNPS